MGMTLYEAERSFPMDAAAIPFPNPEMTPPVMMMNLVREGGEMEWVACE
jgi:hypothetical protein